MTLRRFSRILPKSQQALHRNHAIIPANPPTAPNIACADFIAPAVDTALVGACVVVVAVAAVLTLGRSWELVLELVLRDVRVEDVVSSSSSELDVDERVTAREDERLSRPDAEFVPFEEPVALASTPEPVGVGSSLTRVLDAPQT